jgi:hypothetical protein
MISDKKTIGRVWGVLFAIPFGSLVAITTRHVWPGLNISLILLLFVVLCVGFYFTGVWMMVDHPAELHRKFPISSKELRRRRKEFYDWVDSLGRG